jgi:hypothetical protein
MTSLGSPVSPGNGENPRIRRKDAEDDRPCRDVTRAQFEIAARLAGWKESSIRAYLLPGAAVNDYVPVGKFFLRITDW